MQKGKAKSAVKKRMQDVDFKSVDEFLEFLPETELRIVKTLRNLVFECIPGCIEKLNYNVPFYKRKSNICFIWPGSVKWNGKGHEGIRFGFNKGYLLNDELNYLDRGNRKQIYWKDFHSLNVSDVELIRTFLFEALKLDDNQRK